MSRRKRKNKKNKSITKIVESQADTLKEQIKEIIPEKPIQTKSTPSQESREWPDTVKQILASGEYEIFNGNTLRKVGNDVGFTLNNTFLNSLENPKVLAQFLPPEPEPEPEPVKYTAEDYYDNDMSTIYDLIWDIKQAEPPVQLQDEQYEIALNYINTVEDITKLIKSQVENKNMLKELGAKCLVAEMEYAKIILTMFKEVLYKDD